jgi:hypothetical protein
VEHTTSDFANRRCLRFPSVVVDLFGELSRSRAFFRAKPLGTTFFSRIRFGQIRPNFGQNL